VSFSRMADILNILKTNFSVVGLHCISARPTVYEHLWIVIKLYWPIVWAPHLYTHAVLYGTTYNITVKLSSLHQTVRHKLSLMCAKIMRFDQSVWKIQAKICTGLIFWPTWWTLKSYFAVIVCCIVSALDSRQKEGGKRRVCWWTTFFYSGTTCWANGCQLSVSVLSAT